MDSTKDHFKKSILMLLIAFFSFNSSGQYCDYRDYFKPLAADPVLTVQVVFNVFHPTSGTGVWDALTNNDISLMMDQVKNTFTNTAPPTISGPHTANGKINFIWTRLDHYEDATYNDPDLACQLYSIDGAIQVVMTRNPPNTTPHIRFAKWPLGDAPGDCIKIHCASAFVIDAYWRGCFVHEVAHMFGMTHIDNALSNKFPVNLCGCQFSFAGDVPSGPITSCPPPSGFSNNVMNPGDCREYISPGQFAMAHYYLRTSRIHWLKNQSFIDATTAMAVHDYTIQGSGETWNSPRFYKGNIIVPTGKYLTINCQVAMQNKGKIIVQPGAKLTITGNGHVTNISGRLWEGIDVVGNSSQNQNYNTSTGFSSTQGVLKIENGGKLSQSINAVRNYGHNVNGSINLSSAGGIVIAQNAVFENNVRDVEFLAYPINKASVSRFTDCDFIANSTPLSTHHQACTDVHLPYTHVTMWGIKGVRFLGCKFENDISFGVAGEGIHTIDAIYEVSNSNTRSCEFTNLDKGISAYNPNRLRAAYIFDSKFKNNHNGIILSSVDGAYLGRNSFTITGYANSAPQHGLYLNDCKNYTANSNTLTSTSQPGSYGMFAAYSGKGTHKIFRNTFSNLAGAVLPLYDNSGITNTSDGLLINCNVFNGGTSNSFDIAMVGISGGNVMNVPSVATWQGDINNQSTKKIRNQYGASCTNSSSENKWLINVAQKVVKHPANSSPASMMPTPQPNCSNLLVQLSPGPVFNFNAHCPESEANSSGTPISASNLANSVSAAKGTLQSLKEVWNDSIDNGDTEGLLAQIVSSTVSAGAKTTLLLQSSPYVSDAVLTAYFSNTVITGPLAISVHNNNAPVSPAVWSIITARNWNSTTQTTLDNQQQANSSSARDALESELVTASSNLQSALAEKVRYFMADTLENSIDTVIKVLSDQALIELPLAKVKLAQAYLDAGYTTRAFSYADSLSEVEGFGDIMTLQLHLMKLDTSAKKLWSALENETTFDYFAALAPDSTSPGAWQARAVLNYISNTAMNFSFLYPSTAEGRSSSDAEAKLIESDLGLQADAKTFAYSIFPNPAGNMLNVIRAGAALSAGKIEIVNVLGQISKSLVIKETKLQEINISDLPNGMYFVNLYNNEELVASKKLFVTH